MKTRKCFGNSYAGALLLFVLCAMLGRLAPYAPAAPPFRVLKSFGDLATSGSGSTSRPLLATNGVLYGTTAIGGISNLGTIFSMGADGGSYRVIHQFGAKAGDGSGPASGLIEGSDGALYGTTQYGGKPGSTGTVFRVENDGTGYALLHEFQYATGDGQQPQSGLLEGSDGRLYGTTAFRGSNDVGLVFRVNKDGAAYEVLHRFTDTGREGIYPSSAVIEAPDGRLYGATILGGTNATRGGTIYSMNKDGSSYQVLWSLGKTQSDGSGPSGALLLGSDRALYGTTIYGGVHGEGTIFRIKLDGSDYSILHHCGEYGEGAQPTGGLIEGSDGALYGTMTIGGGPGSGVLYKINKDCSGYAVLHKFLSVEGWQPNAPLFKGVDGRLYGTTSNGGAYKFGSVFRSDESGNGFTVLWSFARSGTTEAGPQGAVLEASDKRLYGTAQYGGVNNRGAIFGLSGGGTSYSTLHEFGSLVNDGYRLNPGLIEGTDGFLYGTTSAGGISNAGTVFRLNKDGTAYTVLFDFGTANGQGTSPAGTILEASDGALYGTTSSGGSNRYGTIFHMTRDGAGYRVLHHFGEQAGDGRPPHSALVEGSDGFLYGTSYGGDGHWGAVFKVSKDGAEYSVIYRFLDAHTDCSNPWSALLKGKDGFLFGTTERGSNSTSVGTVYKLNQDGSGYKTIYRFSDNGLSATPSSPLIEGNDGVLYGTAQSLSGLGGMVFGLNRDGTGFTAIHSFLASGEGWNPIGKLTMAGDGTFYGATSSGGTLGGGTVFQLLPPQTPDLINVTVKDSVPQITFLGMSGYRYQILRSNDLRNWSPLATAAMPVEGLCTISDNTLGEGITFYRAAWVP
jgi:uncharacterized repeat protein (TIGR03803 family)